MIYFTNKKDYQILMTQVACSQIIDKQGLRILNKHANNSWAHRHQSQCTGIHHLSLFIPVPNWCPHQLQLSRVQLGSEGCIEAQRVQRINQRVQPSSAVCSLAYLVQPSSVGCSVAQRVQYSSAGCRKSQQVEGCSNAQQGAVQLSQLCIGLL